MSLTKNERRIRIKKRIRKVVSGTTDVPRLSIFRSNKQIYAQVIDDGKGVTIASACSRNKEVLEAKGNKVEKAFAVGKLVAQRAAAAGVIHVAFDRGGYLYHGRVKSLAEGAREGGLKF